MKFTHTLCRMAAVALMAATATGIFAQDTSADVSLIRQTGSDALLRVTLVASKAGKDAEDMAIKSAFNALLHSGVEGIKDGQPMLSGSDKSYEYRLYSGKRYVNMLSGKPTKADEMKISGIKKISYDVPVNINLLKKDLEKNEQSLNHAWADQKKENTVKTAINPTIVVVPETNNGASFEEMRNLMANDPAYKTAVNKLNELFNENGYTTRDFRTAVQNSKTDDILREGAQQDRRTAIVQTLPGDIVVKVELSKKERNSTYGCDVSVRAVENQTEAVLASETFNSGYYHASDASALAGHALEKMGKDFFTKLSDSFARMAKEGRAMNLDFNISESVADWDFDMESPADGSEFKEELDEWLRSQAFQGVYDMSLSTDKYIKANLNLPLWDAEKGRTYRITNFTTALKRYLRSKLGDEYKVNVTAMGQKLFIVIE